ncbi:YxiG family protein [Metabacillus arenae]|uniref:Uncharacterized protein n=1 Tax=Metabacillus arenae TaxID=2771434 RepID=A0A926NJR6_9BACI|nr:hypothetical protein [Metabacillus arenae]MBD1381853.1 hypothetical protein [Metabacillus arenae]
MTQNKKEICEEINNLLGEHAEFWSISDIQINYLKETITLKLESVNEQEILKTFIKFKQVMSLYMHQDAEVETYRLNNYKETDPFLLSEISYHPNGLGKINVESLEDELTEIESISSSTNFYFQINNKDYFFVEANSFSITRVSSSSTDEKVFIDLISDEKIITNPY